MNSLSYAEAVKSIRNREIVDVSSGAQQGLIEPAISTQEHSDRSTRIKTIPDQAPPNVGISNPINSVNQLTHDKCVSTDVLINFFRTIGLLLLGNYSRDELVSKLSQSLDEFLNSLKKPPRTNIVSN